MVIFLEGRWAQAEVRESIRLFLVEPPMNVFSVVVCDDPSSKVIA